MNKIRKHKTLFAHSPWALKSSLQHRISCAQGRKYFKKPSTEVLRVQSDVKKFLILQHWWYQTLNIKFDFISLPDYPNNDFPAGDNEDNETMKWVRSLYKK